MGIWWPQVGRGGSGRNKKHRSPVVVFSRIGEHLLRAAVLRCSAGRHGSTGRSGREAVKSESNRPQEKGLSKRFLDHPEESPIYHYDRVPRGLPSVHSVGTSGVCIPPDIRGVALPPTVWGDAGIETEPKRLGLCVSEKSAEGQRERLAVVVCRGSTHWCAERALMQMTGSACMEPSGHGRD